MANVDPATQSGAQPAAAAAPEASGAKPRPPVKLRHYLEAGLAYIFMTFLKLLSWPLASNVGGWLGRTLGPLTKPWRIATRNISRALPELPEKDRQDAVRAAFDNFGRVMAEYAQLPKLWGSRWDGLIDVQGQAGLQWAVANKPVIVFTAHIGNWELIPMVLANHGKPAMLVYRAPNNPLVDDMILNIRTTYAAGMAPKGADGLRAIVQHIQDGGTVFMVVDQKTNTGPEIPFFGRGARTGKAIARIAMKYGCKLIPVRSERIGGSRFRITFDGPWSVEGNAGDEGHIRQTLTKLNAKIEEWVRATPGQWMWMHKRWPD
ncbi:MAG: lysophospholipid acyltransferase family protein [Rhodospirillaceae bacterium]|nr:lysophospholipid acyltransferase family protein [Rhodospirillaceae bacterium]